ncbi:MAG: histidine kinase dimerization/phospho-acceptor domain-containing protein [Bradyrhizobium sp.]
MRASHEPVIIDHVSQDAIYCSHHTPAQYGLQSSISMPILLQDGSFFGTLCAIDPKPHKLSDPETIETFKLFAELIATHLDASDRLKDSEATLLDERKTSELREQFIAVLGHDLRNPLASIAAGARMLPKSSDKESSAEILGLMQQQSIARMASLIDNIMDFARGRLGSGIMLTRSSQPVQPVFTFRTPLRCSESISGRARSRAGSGIARPSKASKRWKWSVGQLAAWKCRVLDTALPTRYVPREPLFLDNLRG